MKKLLNKEVCGSHEQYTGLTKQCHSSENLNCQRSGGSRAQCTGLTDRHSDVKCTRQLKKKKKKKGGKRKRSIVDANPNA